MSFAHFDEICKICCEFCEDQRPAEVYAFRQKMDRFPEGFQHEDLYPAVLRETSRWGLNRMVPKEEEAIYVIRYGQYV